MEFNVPWLHGRILMAISGGKVKMFVQSIPVLRESCNNDWGYAVSEVLKLDYVSESCGGHDKTDCWTQSSVSDADKFPEHGRTTGLGTTVWGDHCSHWFCSCGWLVIWPLCSLSYFCSCLQTWKFKVSVRRNNIWLQKSFTEFFIFPA